VSRNSEEGNTLSTPPQSPTPVEDEGSASALTEDELLTAAPTVVANSLGEYLRAWGQRIKNGESGALPVLIGLIAIIIFFQLERSTFLTNGNLVNLLENSAIYVMLGAAETFVLLLSQIDLSLGFGAGVGAFVIAELIAPPVSLPWWLGILGGLLVMATLGLLQGSLIARLGLPSFIVTLGGYLGFQGVMLEVANVDKSAVGGTMTIADNSPVYKLVNSNMSTGLAWVVLIVCVALFAAITIMRSRSRRAQGLTTPPIGVTVLTIALAAIAGLVLVLVCNANRGNLAPLRGMAHLRVPAGVDVDRHRRRRPRAVRRRVGGDRRHQPIRWPRAHLQRAARRHRDRHGLQRPRSNGRQCRRDGHRHRCRSDRRGRARLARQSQGHRPLSPIAAR
jgi:D-xylose transport system permease protein